MLFMSEQFLFSSVLTELVYDRRVNDLFNIWPMIMDHPIRAYNFPYPDFHFLDDVLGI